MLGKLLFSHTYKSRIRTDLWTPGRTIFSVLRLLVVLYFSIGSLIAGYYVEDVLAMLETGFSPIQLVNRFILAGLLALVALRFVTREVRPLKLESYLHLPVSKRSLVLWNTVFESLSVFNLIPLLFILSFWVRSVRGVFPFSWAVFWLSLCVLCIVLTGWVAKSFRFLLICYPVWFCSWVLLLLLIGIIDFWAGFAGITGFSEIFFLPLLEGNWTLFLGGVAVTTFVYLTASMLSRRSLYKDMIDAGHYHPRRRWLSRVRHPRFLLVFSELKAGFRVRSLRNSIFGGLVFLPLIVMLNISVGLYESPLGMFYTAYFLFGFPVQIQGQLAFSWFGFCFDSLLSRPVSLTSLVWARLVWLQILGLLYGMVTLVCCWTLGFSLSLAFPLFMYTFGFFIPLLIVGSAFNRDLVSPGEGKTISYSWVSRSAILVVLGFYSSSLLLIGWLRLDSLRLALMAVGLGSLLLSPLWVRLAALLLERNRYSMAASFRRSLG